jgi:hypothetical protein
MREDQNKSSRGKKALVPLLAMGAVIVVGAVGLTRGCSYAADEPDYENSANGTRDAPDV